MKSCCAFSRRWGLAALAVWASVAATIALVSSPGDPTLRAAKPPRNAATPADDKPAAQTLRGRVIWAADAMRRRYGVNTVADAAQHVLVIETPDGPLVPLVEDIRGGSFRKDKRLRDRDVQLLVRTFPRSPFVQVIKIFAVEKDGVYELDYWCEICAIAMYELKDCDCCQGPIELRERKVSSDGVAPQAANDRPGL